MQPAASSPGHVVVVGAGVAGLSAARDLSAAGWRVTVLEQAAEVGGKLRRVEVGGVGVDVGAEAMLNRRPEGVDLAQAVGLEVEHPAVAASRIWTRGELRPLPRSLMGVPLDLDALAASGVLSPQGLARVGRERSLPASACADDVAVGTLVDERFGPEVTDRLVEPLLGGVYSGRARSISARAAVPQLLAYATRGSVLAQAGSLPTTYAGPVFAGVPGGMARLPEALARALEYEGVEVHCATTVRELHRLDREDEHRFELVVGSAAAPRRLRAGAVVLATPASATSRLLGRVAPVAAGELAEVESASVVVVTLAFRIAAAARLRGLGSGFLVPPVEGRRIKAATFTSAKWAWVADAGREHGLLLLRTSLGRAGEQRALQADDAELVAASLADLAAATGLDAPPVASHVQRWGGGLPQYAVGHLARVERVRAAVRAVPGLAVCGAVYDGVGIPAVIASAHAAAASLGSARRPGTMAP